VERRVWLVHLNRNRDKLGDYIYADDKEQLWRVSARIEALTDLNYGFFVKNIREAVEPVIEKHRAKGVEGIEAVYTGLVPLIYKAQNSLLSGLIFNFVGDLILIGVAIIILLRDWSAGFLLGLPSLFPMACVFGAMGLMGVVVDTGTVMVPAVALGVTVDDAIHFMLWCRHGQERGMNHADSIMFAYGDCARAIYQSWGVIGLGLASFALSSFIPTQRFGVLMFVMLTVSSIGNLVLLPALLAGPAGWFFWRKGEKLMQAKLKATKELAVPEERSDEPAEELVAATESVTIPMVAMEQPGTATRRDRPHRRSTRK
jgi:predicted RND superfamily exporter protein